MSLTSNYPVPSKLQSQNHHIQSRSWRKPVSLAVTLLWLNSAPETTERCVRGWGGGKKHPGNLQQLLHAAVSTREYELILFWLQLQDWNIIKGGMFFMFPKGASGETRWQRFCNSMTLLRHYTLGKPVHTVASVVSLSYSHRTKEILFHSSSGNL